MQCFFHKEMNHNIGKKCVSTPNQTTTLCAFNTCQKLTQISVHDASKNRTAALKINSMASTKRFSNLQTRKKTDPPVWAPSKSSSNSARQRKKSQSSALLMPKPEKIKPPIGSRLVYLHIETFKFCNFYIVKNW